MKYKRYSITLQEHKFISLLNGTGTAKELISHNAIITDVRFDHKIASVRVNVLLPYPDGAFLDQFPSNLNLGIYDAHERMSKDNLILLDKNVGDRGHTHLGRFKSKEKDDFYVEITFDDRPNSWMENDDDFIIDYLVVEANKLMQGKREAYKPENS